MDADQGEDAHAVRASCGAARSALTDDQHPPRTAPGSLCLVV
jgi:hypothetical protein